VTSARLAARPELLGALLIVGGTTLAALVGPIAKILYDEGMTAFTFAVWRGVVAGSALWLLVWVRRRRDPIANPIVFGRLSRRERGFLLAFCVSNIVLNTALFVAFERIPVAVALLCMYMFPVILAVYGRISGTEPLGSIKVAALVIATAGMAMVVLAGFDPSSGLTLDPLGLGLALLSALAAAAWVGFARECRSVPAEQAMGLALTLTVLAIGVLAIVVGPASQLVFPPQHPDVLPLVLFAGVVSGAVAPVLVTKGIRRTTRVRAGILGLTEPIVGVTAAAILVGEVLAPIQLVGGAFVLAGALLSQRASDRPPREADAAPASAPPPQLATDLSTAE
jgi:drug/metabolite transporter (DMT)-like permease